MLIARHRRWVGVAVLAILAACSDGTGPEDPLEGGVMATFEVSGERFDVWVTNAKAIADILALEDGTSMANIPNGALRAGPGPGDYNAPWSWHLDAQDIDMAEAAIEVCDGRPSLVDELLDDYLLVGRFCPWGATLVGVDDRR
ncbi:MAG: hypothetical protein R3195_15920 [Gemmatimonadota bacterium]|nr:hypothetical protein [Gemmatimonadota bacterium]